MMANNRLKNIDIIYPNTMKAAVLECRVSGDRLNFIVNEQRTMPDFLWEMTRKITVR